MRSKIMLELARTSVSQFSLSVERCSPPMIRHVPIGTNVDRLPDGLEISPGIGKDEEVI